MKTQELNYIKTTISWLLENGDFEDSETSYNTAMNSIDILEEAISVTRCCKSDSELLVLFADWLQYNGKWSLPEQQAKDFLKEQQEQN